MLEQSASFCFLVELGVEIAADVQDAQDQNIGIRWPVDDNVLSNAMSANSDPKLGSKVSQTWKLGKLRERRVELLSICSPLNLSPLLISKPQDVA